MNAPGIRLLESRDIPAILRVQANSPEAAQWHKSAYANIDHVGENCWIAERDGVLVGFLVARAMAGEMEILNLAVDTVLRRRGIGQALLQEALSWAAQNGLVRVFLEVRSSNAAARKFYQAQGFASSGIRKDYYRDPIENALVLMYNVAAQPSPN
jgi:[ribosomal protein S18]-alanine N-acetyltransferase